MSESDISNMIAIALSRESRGKIITWRNNVGRGVCGQIRDIAPGQFHVIAGRRIQYGLCPGSSDRIGLVPITVTPEMIGRTFAVFLALEVKTPSGMVSPEQVNFIEAVRRSGGLAGVVRSIDEAIGVCNPLL